MNKQQNVQGKASYQWFLWFKNPWEVKDSFSVIQHQLRLEKQFKTNAMELASISLKSIQGDIIKMWYINGLTSCRLMTGPGGPGGPGKPIPSRPLSPWNTSTISIKADGFEKDVMWWEYKPSDPYHLSLPLLPEKNSKLKTKKYL